MRNCRTDDRRHLSAVRPGVSSQVRRSHEPRSTPGDEVAGTLSHRGTRSSPVPLRCVWPRSRGAAVVLQPPLPAMPRAQGERVARRATGKALGVRLLPHHVHAAEGTASVCPLASARMPPSDVPGVRGHIAGVGEQSQVHRLEPARLHGRAAHVGTIVELPSARTLHRSGRRDQRRRAGVAAESSEFLGAGLGRVGHLSRQVQGVDGRGRSRRPNLSGGVDEKLGRTLEGGGRWPARAALPGTVCLPRGDQSRRAGIAS